MPEASKLDAALEYWFVMEDTPEGPPGWYAVGNEDESVIAYFSKEKDALRCRLAEVNRMING